MKQRWCLKTDDDSHWYLIKIEDQSLFNELCSSSYEKDDFSQFNNLFDNYRINGPYNLSFEYPMDLLNEYILLEKEQQNENK